MKINKHLVLSILLVLVIVLISCSKKEAEALDINFSLDNHNLFSLNKDYSEEDFDLYKNDPDKVFYSLVDHPIKIKTSDDVRFMENVSWQLNDKDWQISKNPNDFQHAFELPGLYKITMEVNDIVVTKFVRIIENEKRKSLNKDEHSKQKANQLGTEKIDFIIDNMNPNKWQAILVQDVSRIDDKISRRIWDFGDGTVIPTVGNSVKYSYSKPGMYEIKLCLNLSNKCAKKRIIVNDKNEMEAAGIISNEATSQDSENSRSNNGRKSNKVGSATSDSNQGLLHSSKKRSERDKIEIHEVKLSVPSKGHVGTPLRFVDLSSPAEAVKYRNWYVNGVEQNFHQKSIDMIFDEEGSYKIKMCLNYLSKNCVEKEILVSNKKIRKNPKLSAPVGPISVPYDKRSPTPTFQPMADINHSSDGFLCQSYGKAGAIFEYKCAQDVKYFNGVSIITLKPEKDVELHSAKIVGNTIGFVDVIISDVEKSEVAVLKRIQVLPGKTTVEFAELALTLKAGKQYELTMATLPQKSKRQKKLKLLNSSTCKVPQYENETLIVNYQDDVQLLFDIKFCY